jgi:hypothetical protein
VPDTNFTKETIMSTAVFDTVGNSTAQATVRSEMLGHVAPVTVLAPPADHPLPRLRITARGRAVLMVVVTTPIVAVLLALALNGGGAIATESGSGAPMESVTVLAGQSLWQLAEELAPQSDPREFITDVLSVNTLASADVRAGQLLEIPNEYTE